MKKTMITVSVLSCLCLIICLGFYTFTQLSIMLTLAITFLTISYHFLMRLSVGFILDKAMHNKADYKKPWFQSKKWEKHFYELLKVKQWKKKVPTYDKRCFDFKKRRLDEILGAMCQAELVHKVIIVLSFVPILFSIWFGATIVFVITSVLSALFDLIFVIVQRYNRPRMVRMKNRTTEMI